MAIEKSRLQRVAPRSPRPKKMEWQEWLAKMLTQEVAGGAVQLGVSTAADYATSDLKRDRQIAVQTASTNLRQKGDMRLDATKDLRRSIQEVFSSEAGLNDEIGDLRQMRTIVARGQKSVSGTRTYITVDDIAEAAGLVDVKLAALKKRTPQEGLSQAEAMATTQKIATNINRLEKMVGRLKSASTNTSAMKNPKLAQAMFEEIIREGEENIIQAKADNWKVFQERAAINVKASQDGSGKPSIELNWKAIQATRESRQVKAIANAATTYHRDRLLDSMKGDPEAFEALVASGKLMDPTYAMNPLYLHPALDLGKDGKPNPLYETYGQHFSGPVARALGLDPKKVNTEYLHQSFIKGVHIEGLTPPDRVDQALIKAEGTPPTDITDAAKRQQVMRAGHERTKRRSEYGPLPQSRETYSAPKTSTLLKGAIQRDYKPGDVHELVSPTRASTLRGDEAKGMLLEREDALSRRNRLAKEMVGAQTAPYTEKQAAQAAKGTYKVKGTGRTLADVSKVTGVPVHTLQRLNFLKGGGLIPTDYKLRSGVKLKIPKKSPVYASYSSYFLADGDK